MKRASKGRFPSASGVDQATLWQTMAIVTPVDTAASLVTSKLKRASEARLNLETSIWFGG